jgi:hypothetical protein
LEQSENWGKMIKARSKTSFDKLRTSAWELFLSSFMDKHFILHLTLIDSIGPTIIQRIQKRSDVNASDLYLFSQADWMNVFGFTPVTAEKLFEGLQNKKILEYELTLIAQHNIARGSSMIWHIMVSFPM